MSPRRHVLCIEVSSIQMFTYNRFSSWTKNIHRVDRGHKRQGEKETPESWLLSRRTCFSRVSWYIYGEMEHYITYFVKGNTRGCAYCEIRTGYFSATGDTGPIRRCMRPMPRAMCQRDAPVYKDLRVCRHTMEACKYVGQPNGTARVKVRHWMESWTLYTTVEENIPVREHRWTILCHVADGSFQVTGLLPSNTQIRKNRKEWALIILIYIDLNDTTI